MRFPGQYFDQETNNHYNYFRDYDPAIGSFIQPEPLGLVGDIQLYRYARSNPLRFVDPDGRQAIPIGGGAAGTGLGGLGGFGLPNPFSRPRRTDDPLSEAMSQGGSSSASSSSLSSSSSCPVPCPPCTPYSVGTVGYLGPHYGAHYSKYHGMNLNPHLNLFVVNQRPDCRCFWNKNWPDAAPPPPAAGWVDLNGGFPPLSP